jgi:UDP-arabinose 4-epimerase
MPDAGEPVMTRTLLVTGGAGYIGSHACKAFAQAGWRVVVFDNLSRGHRDLVRWGDLITGDLLDTHAIGEALQRVRPDAVAHFAAVAYVGESVSDPGMYWRNNVLGTLNLLDAMRASGTRRLIFSSTCATYGVHDTPITEDSAQNPINPYGWTKLCAEKVISTFQAAHGLEAVILRYFNACGADPDGETGERHDPEPHVIPRAVLGALDGSFRFEILGDNYPTPDGTCIRDYIHVTDLAEAHRLALDHLFAGKGSDVFNLGSGQGTSVRELADAVDRAAGRALPRHIAPRRPGDPPSLTANPDKARRVLGWQPTRSDIDIIVADAWAWHTAELARGRIPA